MIELRPFQQMAIDDLTTEAGQGKRRLLLQAPTGAGKTCIASKIIQHATSNDQRTLFLCHRRELVLQCSDKLEKLNVPHGVILSGDQWDPTRLVNVASIQTLYSWAVKRKRVDFPRADLVVIDEAHHFNSSKTWQKVVEPYPQAIVLGMTATPINRRGKGMGHYFDVMVCCPTIQELVDEGYLVPARYFAPSPVDLKGLKVVAGDYAEGELEKRMDTPKLIGDICENWGRKAENRQTLVFASGVKHSIHIAEAFNKIGVSAAHVDGNTPTEERDQILRDFRDEKIKVLCNCGVYTEGTDIPSASCLVFARPTKSLLLYLQVAGRVLRTYPNKKDAIFLDHAGACYEHGKIEQNWQWQLDYGQGDIRTATPKPLALKREITCEKCKAVYWGQVLCPECGNKPLVKGREVLTWPGYLQALDEIENPKIDERAWYLQLMGYARKSGKKDGWAFFKFKERFGEGRKPEWGWRGEQPIEPGTEVLAWIQKQNRTFFWKQKNPELAAHMERKRADKELRREMGLGL